MNDYSLVKKLEILMNMVISSPLFLFCCMIGVAVLIFFIICIRKEKQINKWIFISIWLILGIILLINYNTVIFKAIDSLFDSMFMALYFPSLGIYIVVVLISNFFLIYSLINKKMDKKSKIINFIYSSIINLFLVLIVDTIKNNNINIYDNLNIYNNSNLLVLFQLTTALFASWILISLLVSAHNKLKKYDEKEYPSMPEIIFEDI